MILNKVTCNKSSSIESGINPNSNIIDLENHTEFEEKKEE